MNPNVFVLFSKVHSTQLYELRNLLFSQQTNFIIRFVVLLFFEKQYFGSLYGSEKGFLSVGQISCTEEGNNRNCEIFQSNTSLFK